MTMDAFLTVVSAGAPASLQHRMREAAGDATPAASGGALAASALTELARVLAAPSDRSAAFTLLTADALITAAFEAAAQDPGSMVQLAEELGPARFAALLPG